MVYGVADCNCMYALTLCYTLPMEALYRIFARSVSIARHTHSVKVDSSTYWVLHRALACPAVSTNHKIYHGVATVSG